MTRADQYINVIKQFVQWRLLSTWIFPLESYFTPYSTSAPLLFLLCRTSWCSNWKWTGSWFNGFNLVYDRLTSKHWTIQVHLSISSSYKFDAFSNSLLYTPIYPHPHRTSSKIMNFQTTPSPLPDIVQNHRPGRPFFLELNQFMISNVFFNKG